MTINIDQYILKHRQLPYFTEAAAHALGDYAGLPSHRHEANPQGTVYNIKWGENQRSVRHGVMESGFLWDALHFDTLGIYDRSSLNLGIPSEPVPIPAKDLLPLLPVPASKFRQPVDEGKTWSGVVLALQNPTDRSVMTVAHERDYYEFVEDACRYYGKRLFLKLHPWNRGEVEARFRELAARWGCSIGKVGHSIIEHCEFCLVFNSTFAFDCFVRGVSVMQFAPGYFWNTGAVCYTNWSINEDRVVSHGSRPEDGQRLVDFCIWNYMIHCKIGGRDWVRLIRHFYDDRNKRWPLQGHPHLSWAGEMILRHLPEHPAAQVLRAQRQRYDAARPALPDLVDAPVTDPVELAGPT